MQEVKALREVSEGCQSSFGKVIKVESTGCTFGTYKTGAVQEACPPVDC